MQKTTCNRITKKSANALSVILLFISSVGFSQQKPAAATDYFVVENYYKVKWGYADEFIDLWKTNHYPLLKKAIEKGDIISVNTYKPRYHSGEDTRWDFRVILVFKTAAAAFDANLTEPYKKEQFPDQEKYKKAEQYRFSLLLAHWDIETESIPLQ